MTEPLSADPLETLRARTSEKWTAYPEPVLPLFVAEMDYPLAPAIMATLVERVQASDTGYLGGPGRLGESFAGFAARCWGWEVEPALVRTTTDVSVAIVEILRAVIQPGDGVVITPPVYPPFFTLPVEAGGTIVEVPLKDDGSEWMLDLDGLEAAFAAGARAFLLCNPHNPLGLVHSRETLLRVAGLAARYNVAVVSDEIHAALVLDGPGFTPFLSVSDDAARVGITVTSASKAFNLAGVKCALMVAGSEQGLAVLDRLDIEVGFRTSILGFHASLTAFDGDADDWLAGVTEAVRQNRALLVRLLREQLPSIRYRPGAASYLAWLDVRELGWGDDPAERALERGVALNDGSTFGAPGFLRLNLACSPEVLTEAIRRLAA